MKYTIYEIEILDTNEKYVSAYSGIKNPNKIRIFNKNIVPYIKGKNTQRKILSIEESKKDAEIFLKNLKNSGQKNVIRIDKKISVLDKKGNLYKVYRDDPKYLSGEFFHYLKNKIMAKDLKGNFKLVDKNSKEWIDGSLVGIQKNRVTVKDSEGNYLSVNKNDKRYKSGKLKFFFVGKKFIKRKQKKGYKINMYDSKLQKKYMALYKNKYPLFNKNNIRIKGKFLWVENYCEHGDLFLTKSVFKSIYETHNKWYCYKCRDAYLQALNLKKEDIENYRNKFKNLTNKKYNTSAYKEKFLYNYYPEIYKIIKDLSHKLNCFWIESCFIFKNNLSNIPKCSFEKCNSKVQFSETAKHYNLYCDQHMYNFNRSILEKEILNFIQFVIGDDYEIKTNVRNIIKGELDIFIPGLKLAIEINGLYNHCEIFKNRDYHKNKWQNCKNSGITLLTIWEDDWNCKSNILKSIIKNKLRKTEKIIYARNCKIKLISYNETKEFLLANHLQGHCPSGINLGLFYKNNLVSIMTFGKRRKIIKNLSFLKNEYELLRFCNKLDVSVIGGASKLLKFFISNYNFSKITSYANLDLGNGDFYKKIGFKHIKYTEPNYWWWKSNGIKIHRSNFMKWKLVKEGEDPNKSATEIMLGRGYYRIWGSGNAKYILMNEEVA